MRIIFQTTTTPAFIFQIFVIFYIVLLQWSGQFCLKDIYAGVKLGQVLNLRLVPQNS